MSKASQCPQCGQPLPDNAPAGLCPHCLMALNLKTETVFTDDAPAAQPPLPPEQIAPHFPQLEILECLGRGGMGVVYKARQKTLNRLVALKLLAPERVGDVKFAGRFTREAQALAALNHPNIVTIHDFGQAGGFYFLLMEFVDGANLRQLLRTRKFTPEEALAIVPTLCDALQFAHERGIVHRDIKPENLLLDKAGRVKIADFGIAKMLGTGQDVGGEKSSPESATQNALGTPGYSAPEQKSDPQRVDSRADIYSLGVVFYEMLTGELPGKKIEPPSRKVQIDVRLDEVVLRALEKTPERRWQTAADLRTQVETIASGGNQPVAALSAKTGMALDLDRERWRIVVWGFALAVAGVFMGLHMLQPYSLAIGILTLFAFLISTPLALMAGNSLPKLKFAAHLVLIDGIVVASTAIWCAFNSPMLIDPWRDAIVVACIGGIIYCLRGMCKWAKLKTLGTEAQASQPAVKNWQSRWSKFLCRYLPGGFVVAMVIHTFFLQPFSAGSDAAAPEIPRGSHFLVWKLAHTFVPGDLVAYQLEGWANVGRVVGNEDGCVVVNRTGRGDLKVPASAILGKVVSIYWRASNDETPAQCLWPSTEGERGFFRSSNNQIESHAMSLATLISYAYGPSTTYVHWSENRVILPPDVSTNRFDIQLDAAESPHETLQAAIKKQLGLVAHREVRDADVLVLTVFDPAVISLAVANGGNGSDSGAGPGRNSFEFSNMPIDDVSDFLEASLGKPVINETELTQKYSGSFKWQHQSDLAAELKEVQKVLATQLGLQLVPRREPVEMLVVEKAQ